ncbi:hypothetical protein QR680_018489 [Steinernema hermaphroditum]|uniref:Uncharacterized protein n=1 Tax=Steinernema hermaphroditum TaxID=289476 RepID=A0AA39HJD2_9BILA|nr:hypothetical protein QR680_018489 [Steinernema hermaphroditum]
MPPGRGVFRRTYGDGFLESRGAFAPPPGPGQFNGLRGARSFLGSRLARPQELPRAETPIQGACESQDLNTTSTLLDSFNCMMKLSRDGAAQSKPLPSAPESTGCSSSVPGCTKIESKDLETLMKALEELSEHKNISLTLQTDCYGRSAPHRVIPPLAILQGLLSGNSTMYRFVAIIFALLLSVAFAWPLSSNHWRPGRPLKRADPALVGEDIPQGAAIAPWGNPALPWANMPLQHLQPFLQSAMSNGAGNSDWQ